MQTVCFSPLAMLNAWSSGTKPWSYPQVEAIIREYIELRMRLLPYFYSAFARYHFDGTPPFRAMALEAATGSQPASGPDDDALMEIDDQYIAGDSLLVAPLFAGQTEREVLLPAGDWYDFRTGERFAGGQRMRVNPGLAHLPVFARDGAVIPMMPPLPYAPRAGEAVPLEVRHYGTHPGVFSLFDDDGETFAYERGEYRWRKVEVRVAPDGERQGAIEDPEPGWRSSYGEVAWRWFG